jgi:hypothetical protein
MVGRKVWVNMGYFNIYPNLYVVLLAPPGNKKTTAMNCAKNLIREVKDIPFTADCQSKENLVKEMSTYKRTFTLGPNRPPEEFTPISAFVTELSQFIGIDPIRMLDFLTTIYDQNFYDMKTQKHGQQIIMGPYFCLLGCTVPDWITTQLKGDVISGGFSRRCIFVYETEDGQPIAFPIISPEMQVAWERCVVRGKELKTLAGEFRWDPEARLFYKHWYETRTISKDPNITYFDRTSFIQVLKVAMLLSLSEGNSLTLTRIHIETAQALLLKIMARLPEVFRGLGRNELAQVSAKLEGHLMRAGGPITKKELQALLWNEANSMDFHNIISHLTSVGQLIQFKRKKGTIEVEWVALPSQFEELKQKETPPV